jgi:hypothetical protein
MCSGLAHQLKKSKAFCKVRANEWAYCAIV